MAPKGIKGKKILVGVTGSVAAFKAIRIVEGLKRLGADVKVVATENALFFVKPGEFKAPFYSELFSEKVDYRRVALEKSGVEHVSLADWADAVVIAPCTAATIGKMAHGIADNLLLSTLLATKAPILVAPAMNDNMWAHPAVRRNVALLRRDGVGFVGPVCGPLACGRSGVGRMSEPGEIVAAVEGLLKDDLKGFRVVVTAGGTVEKIDAVRALANLSSGRMGCAIAEAARRRGAEVVLVATETVSVPLPAVRVVRVGSAREMEKAVLDGWAKADALVMAAAVADFAPKKFAGKMRSGKKLLLSLYPNPDILAEAGRRKKPGQVLAGFALEAGDSAALVRGARKKLAGKNLDLVVANPPETIGSADAEVVLVKKTGERRFPAMPKERVADVILDEVSGLLRRPEKR